MNDAEKIAELRRVLLALTDEVASIVALDSDASLQSKIAEAQAVLAATK